MNVPTLETARLILNAHTVEDVLRNFAIWSKPQVVKHISGTPSTMQQCWWRVLRYAGHWSLNNYGYWAVREKVSGQYIGDVGFQDNLRAIGPVFDVYPEAGWVFDPHFHGLGYATEAMTAALGWSESVMKSRSTACLIAPQNQASLKLSKKLGYRVIGEAPVQDVPTLILLRG